MAGLAPAKYLRSQSGHPGCFRRTRIPGRSICRASEPATCGNQWRRHRACRLPSRLLVLCNRGDKLARTVKIKTIYISEVPPVTFKKRTAFVRIVLHESVNNPDTLLYVKDMVACSVQCMSLPDGLALQGEAGLPHRIRTNGYPCICQPSRKNVCRRGACLRVLFVRGESSGGFA